MSNKAPNYSVPALKFQVISANDRLSISLLQSLKLLLRELISNRHHIVEGWSLELKLIARQSNFSFLWVLINAILPILFFGWLRSAVMDSQSRAGFAYVAIGYWLWTLMVDLMKAPSASLKKNKVLMQQSQLPLSAIIMMGYTNTCVDFFLRICLVIITLLIIKTDYLSLLHLTYLLIVPILFGISGGLILLIVLISKPDIYELIELFFRYGLFVSCVIFPLPDTEFFFWFESLNPFASIIIYTRDILMGDSSDFLIQYLSYALIATILTLLSLRTLYVLEPRLRGNL
jgi:ABC-type polysaccharide/polyol phosphate export permease